MKHAYVCGETSQSEHMFKTEIKVLPSRRYVRTSEEIVLSIYPCFSALPTVPNCSQQTTNALTANVPFHELWAAARATIVCQSAVDNNNIYLVLNLLSKVNSETRGCEITC